MLVDGLYRLDAWVDHGCDALTQRIEGESRELELQFTEDGMGERAALQFSGHQLHEHAQITGCLDQTQRFDLFSLGEGYLGACLVRIFL